MNTIQVRDSISNYISHNIKPIDTKLIEENALHLKSKIRQIRDQTTDSFVEVMFKYDYTKSIAENNDNTIKRNLFLLYVYDYFKLNLIANFNSYLMENKCVLLDSSTEYVDFLFKGGNILFVYIDNLIKTNNLFRDINPEYIDKINVMFNEYFKPSDFDFGVYLKTDTHEKFLLIKRYLIKFLINKLEEINLFFNSYLTDIFNNSNIFNSKFKNGTNIFIPNIPILEPEISLLEQEIPLFANGLTTLALLSQPDVPEYKAVTIFTDDLTHSDRVGICIFDIINKKIIKIYNNIFFDKFLLYIKSNNLLHIFTEDMIKEDILINITQFVSDFESEKIYIIINDFIVNIRLINILIDKYINILKTFSNNKYYLSKLINIISMLDFINNKYGIQIFTHTLCIHILYKIYTMYFTSLQQFFIKKKFYTDHTFIDILSRLKNKLTKLSNLNSDTEPYDAKIFYEDPRDDFLFIDRNTYLDSTNYKSYVLREKYTDSINDIFTVVGRDNTAYIKNINENNLYINNLPNNFHYITFNSSINTSSNNNNNNVAFELLRSKLNIKLKYVHIKKYVKDTWTKTYLDIPSEYIDISISNIGETSYEFYFNGNNKTTLQLYIPLDDGDFHKFEIETYKLTFIIHDLNNILWNQNYCPWIDNKYIKRVGRLLFLFGIQENGINFNILLDLYHLINLIKNYLNNGLLETELIAILSLFKFNDIDTYLTKFSTKIAELHHNKISYNKYSYYDENQITPSYLDKMFNEIILLFLIYQLNSNSKEAAINIVKNYRHTFNYYDFTRDEYDEFIINIQKFFNDIYELLETKIIPNITILRNNLPENIV